MRRDFWTFSGSIVRNFWKKSIRTAISLENSVHASDTMEEQLSLSDRFGITVLFASTNKRDYLSIVEQLAKDRNLRTEAEKLDLLAERWALAKGGRSPRRAKQFIDFAYACEKKNIEIEF